MLGLTREGDATSGVQERLRRDATTVETNTPETLIALDHDNFLPEVSGVESGGIATRPGANYDDLCFDRIHINFLERSRTTRRLLNLHPLVFKFLEGFHKIH